MLPIFNEYIQFLKDHNIDLDLQEGYYWLDRQIIKAYDKKGKRDKMFNPDYLDCYFKHKKEIEELLKPYVKK